jgi:hypothetical protein
MDNAVSNVEQHPEPSCSGTSFVLGTKAQMWGDVALMSGAAIASAFLSRALRLRWDDAAPAAFLAAAIALMSWLFVRQFLRGERGWMFYTAMILFAGLPEKSEVAAGAAAPAGWQAAVVLLAGATAAVGIVGAVRIVRALDEMWRQVNYRALAFAFIATLTAVLAQWLLATLGVDVLTWRTLLLLMVVLWGTGMLWGYRRLR